MAKTPRIYNQPEALAIPVVASTTTVTLSQSYFSLGAVQLTNTGVVTLNGAATGINGLDTGALGAVKFYYIHVVSNSGALGLVASLSKTAPTGFSTFRWTGYAFYTNDSSQIKGVTNTASTGWMVITPSLLTAGFTSVSSNTGEFRRINSNMEYRGSFTLNTTGAAVGGVILPGSLALDTNFVNISNTTAQKSGNICGAFVNTPTGGQNGHMLTATGTSSNNVYTGNNHEADGLGFQNASSQFTTGGIIAYAFSVAINGWNEVL